MTNMKDQIQEEVATHRKADHSIAPQFLNRWSPRSFSTQDVPDEVLMKILEAGRWAPSASNIQPWRFIVARTKEDREVFHSFINEGNLVWCKKVPVFVLILSHTLTPNEKHNRSHSFDAGTAWGYMALQAKELGLITRAMGGFNPDKAKEVLNIPEDYEAQSLIAIGYRGPVEDLPEDLQQREIPNTRRPITESTFEGKFGRELHSSLI